MGFNSEFKGLNTVNFSR